MSEEKKEVVKVIDLTKSEKRDLKFYKVLNISWTNKDTGATIGGVFTVKRLSLGDVAKVGIRTAQLNGGMDNVHPTIQELNSKIAHLEVAVTEAPPEWDPLNMYDATVIQAVYNEVLKFEQSFRPAVGEGRKGTEDPSA